MRFANPQNDIAFKKIFGDEHRKDVLISFLNAVLGLEDVRAIEHIDLLSPYELPKIALLKQTILDVRARDGKGKTFIVEMQVDSRPSLRKRFQYYTAKTYVNQIEVGEDYPKLNQVIFIGILSFAEFEGKNWLTRHLLLNTDTGQQDLNDLEFNFIELSKFDKTEEDLKTILDKWVWFIKHAPDLEVIPLHAQVEPALTHAYETANRHGWTKEELEIYESIAMRLRGDMDQREQDKQKGLIEGEAKGRAEGRKEGRIEGRVAIARNLLDVLDDATIAATSGLTVEEIRQLRESKE